MSFSSELAGLVASQLNRFLKINQHQIAQQAANLDFWLAQAKNSLEVIDGYQNRLQVMQQVHEAVIGGMEMDFERKRWFIPPHKLPDTELQTARRTLARAVFDFVERCAAEGLIPETRPQEVYDRLGIAFEADMIRRQRR